MAAAEKKVNTTGNSSALSVVGLFAGIGGIELGLEAAGHTCKLLCEIDPGAQAVLRHHLPGRDIVADVRDIASLPDADLVTAGFPCQDLSQAGRTRGIEGRNSGLVAEVLRLVSNRSSGPRWLLFENVPFMLQLERGRAMRYLTETLSSLGFSWAYRVVDTRAFGLPQRRQRVIFLASRSEDPREILFVGNEQEPAWLRGAGSACGFYWTEGYTGLGWAIDAVPTLKGGSTIGIPSPPAIWMPDGSIVTPDIRDAERLQGFPTGWTEPALEARGVKKAARWKLVGNAVSCPVAAWVGERLRAPVPYDGSHDSLIAVDKPWPIAAWGQAGQAFKADLTPWPVLHPYRHLADFMQFPSRLLSERATAGFLSRTDRSGLRFVPEFLAAMRTHRHRMELAGLAAV